MDFLEYLNYKQKINSSATVINESFSIKEMDKVHDLMLNIFKKKISKKVFKWDWLDTEIDGMNMKSFYFIDISEGNAPKVWALNYLTESESTSVYSISFFNVENSLKFLWGDTNNIKANLTISTMGTSVAYFIPIICKVIKEEDWSLTKSQMIKLSKEILNEGKKNQIRVYEYGNLNYNIYENYSEDDALNAFYINNGYNMVIDESSEAQNYRWQKKAERDAAYDKAKRTRSQSDKEEFERIQAEYKAIVDAVKGGAQTISEINMKINKNVNVTISQDPSIQKIENTVEEEKRDPKQAFRDMRVYTKMVIQGTQPAVIFCGAPGIGKTYRILQQLKAAGYNDGHNLEIIKGKCTPRRLYLALYNYKDPKNIILIDDADALVGPKAPEDVINILKAALDSTSTDQGRKVSYQVGGKLLDDEGNELPKTLYYNGGIIVITNYSAGQLDTALRGRAFIQSLDFTTEQLLDIIEDLLPKIDSRHLSMQSKEKALTYLKKLAESKEEIEISIRTFTTCAKLYNACEDEEDITEADVEYMIKEQMKNQALRGGKKY